MSSDIRLLEQLVDRAVDRLKKLTEERDRLRDEVGDLRRRLEETEGGRNGSSEQAWRVQREQIVSELKEALSELRGG